MAITRILTNKARKEIFEDNWPIRRRWMKVFMVLLWLNAEGVLIWSIWTASSIGLQAFFALLSALVGVMVFYIFGAIWDDNGKRRLYGELGRDRHIVDDDLRGTAPPSEEEDE